MIKKEDLFKIQLKTKVVDLGAGSISIKEFTTSAREQFEMLAVKMQKGSAKNMKAKLIAMSCINDNGTRYFGDDEIDKISELPSNITEILFNEILEINGMGVDAIGDAEGN